jgi:hypothetical protein
LHDRSLPNPHKRDSASRVAGRFFSALSKNGIGLLGTTTSEIKISVLVHKSDSFKAVSALAREFDLLEAGLKTVLLQATPLTGP